MRSAMPYQRGIRLIVKFFHHDRPLEGAIWAGELPGIYE